MRKSLECYRSSAFTPNFMQAGAEDATMKRVPDTGWQGFYNVVVTCGRLIGGGKRVSRSIITALAEFR